jgi:hypothetical protein
LHAFLLLRVGVPGLVGWVEFFANNFFVLWAPISFWRKYMKVLQLAAGLIASFGVFGVAASAQARPALTQDVDQPGRNVFTLRADPLSGGGASFAVPSNQRYVIDHYTGDCGSPSSTYMIDVELVTSSNGIIGIYHSPAHYTENVGFGLVRFGGTGDGPVYADPGSTIFINVHIASGNPSDYRGCALVVAGHFINNP